jgi:CubicO group peptidase (beta-lactamase class C family)
MTLRAICATLLLTLGAAPAPAQEAPAERVGRLLESLAGYGYGGALAVAAGGVVVHRAGYGQADRERGTPVEAGTRFDIGSLTKPFTAALVLRLVEDGELALGDTMGGLLPGTPADKSAITVEQLLTHTSGLVRSAAALGVGEDTHREAALEAMMGSELLFAPGERYEYSDTGYDLLAAIAEMRTGEPYPALLARLVLAPAGLEQTGYAAGGGAIGVEETGGDEAVAWGYSAPFGVPWSEDREGLSAPTWYNLGSGGLYSTVEDLLRFESALRAGKILAPGTVERMTTAHAPIAEGRAYGYGWFVEESPRGRLVYHGGDIAGYKAHLARYADQGVVFAALGNVFGWERATDRDAIAAWFGGGPVAPPAPDPDADLSGFEGTYRTSAGDPLVVWTEAGKLAVEVAGQSAVDLVFGAAGGETAERTRAATRVIEALEAGDEEFVRSLLRERDRAAGFAGFLLSIWGRLAERSGPALAHTVLGSWPAQDGTVVSLVEVEREGGADRLRLIWRGDRLVSAGGDEGLRRPLALFEATGPATAARYDDASGGTATLTFADGSVRIASAAGAAVAARDHDDPIDPPVRSLVRALLPVFVRQGAEEGLARHERLVSTEPGGYDFGEDALNDLGYALLRRGATDAAIAVFRRNVADHPDSWNAHDSLGEAYLAAGRIEEARASYAESLELNPENETAREVLEGS